MSIFFRAARAIFLSIEPAKIYWVGKGGKSKFFSLDNTLSIIRGQFATDNSPVKPFIIHYFPEHNLQAIFPSEQFRKYGTPQNAGCYVNLKNMEEQVDLEFPNVDELENFLIIIEHLHSTITVGAEGKLET